MVTHFTANMSIKLSTNVTLCHLIAKTSQELVDCSEYILLVLKATGTWPFGPAKCIEHRLLTTSLEFP